MMLLKQRELKFFDVETWLLFALPIKIYGYAPAFQCDNDLN